MQITAEMERFMESHDDVVYADHDGKAFSLIRLIQGDDIAGMGTTMQEAYDAALMVWEMAE